MVSVLLIFNYTRVGTKASATDAVYDHTPDDYDGNNIATIRFSQVTVHTQVLTAQIFRTHDMRLYSISWAWLPSSINYSELNK